MPKYVPTYDELEEIHPCFCCGMDTFDSNKTFCSDNCRRHYDEMENDYEEYLREIHEEEEMENDYKEYLREIHEEQVRKANDNHDYDDAYHYHELDYELNQLLG